MERETGDGAEYGLAKPVVCCFAFKRKVAMLDDIDDVMQGSAAARYIYGFVGVVYGHGAAPTFVLVSVEPIVPGNMELFMLTATLLAPVLKQFTEFW